MAINSSSWMGDFVPAMYATLAGFVIGGIIKIFEKFLDRRKNSLEEHLLLRKELREELEAVKEELRCIQTELDEWKEKYYHQVELTNALKLDVLKLTEELDEYKKMSNTFLTISDDTKDDSLHG